MQKWAVDINQFACESLKLNHPETHVEIVRNGVLCWYLLFLTGKSALHFKFGGSLFEKLPKIWNCLAEFVKPCTIEGLNAEDEKLIDQAIESIRDPQILINNIQVVRSIAILLDETLRPKLLTLLPYIFRCVRHSHTAVRLSTSKCITAIAKSMALDVMGAVIENAVPMLGDMTSVHGRQGAGCLLVCLWRDWDWNLSLMLLC
ncbi:TATA-binding protein-associated factor BTAF1 [Forsythia ovata]|uniref:TATA-binding protein-associated factor BTAF1 n=1 Tax=Forsythia ovata TaxID=205694 RepID=A0ABD1WW22_9LAMI